MTRRLLLFVLAAAAFSSSGGCAYVSEHSKDVTDDRRYWIEYRPGGVYRLKSDARLVAFRKGTRHEQLELWSAGVMARYHGYASFLADFSPVAMVPAGSTVRVESLWHNYAVNFPPVPGEPRSLKAFGTVTSPAGEWRRVLLPDDQTRPWHEAPASVMVFPVDGELLEEVSLIEDERSWIGSLRD